MKLKDYRDNPKQYEEIKRMCAQRNISVTDETDINDILLQSKTTSAKIRAVGFALDARRRNQGRL
jgi:hypothetical protein